MALRSIDAKDPPRIASSLEDFQGNSVVRRLKRYMSLEKFFDLIVNEHLTFSRLSEFEDKSEGYEGPAVLKADAEAFFEDLFDRGADRGVVNSLITDLSSCETYADLLLVLRRGQDVTVGSAHTAEFIFEINRISQRIAYPASKRWFCLCFSQKDAEDYLLWSAYTRGRLGVCVEFCSTQLISQLDVVGYAPGNERYKEKLSEILFGPVQYRPSLRDNPSTREEDYVFTKSEHFSGEQEFRVAGKVSNYGISSNNFHIKLPNLSGLVKGVSLSPFYSAWEAEAVKASIQAVWEKGQGTPLKVSLSNVTKPIA